MRRRWAGVVAIAAVLCLLPTPRIRATSSCSTPTVVTTYNTAGTNGGTSGSFSTSGDLWVGAVSSYTGTAVTVSDSLNGGNWSCTTAQNNVNGNKNQLCYRESPTNGSATVTLTGSSTYPSIIFLGITGSIGAGAFDQTAGNTTDAGTTLAPGTITPSQNDEIVITSLSSGASANADMTVSGNGVTKLSGFDQVGGVNIAGAVGYVIQSTAGSTSSVQWASTTSTIGLSAVIASFKCNSVAAGGSGKLPFFSVGK